MIDDKQILDWDSKEGIPSEDDIAVKEQELIEAYKKLKYQRDRVVMITQNSKNNLTFSGTQ